MIARSAVLWLPLVLSLSKDEPSRSWFDQLTTSEKCRRDARARRDRLFSTRSGSARIEEQP